MKKLLKDPDFRRGLKAGFVAGVIAFLAGAWLILLEVL